MLHTCVVCMWSGVSPSKILIEKKTFRWVSMTQIQFFLLPLNKMVMGYQIIHYTHTHLQFAHTLCSNKQNTIQFRVWIISCEWTCRMRGWIYELSWEYQAKQQLVVLWIGIFVSVGVNCKFDWKTDGLMWCIKNIQLRKTVNRIAMLIRFYSSIYSNGSGAALR